MYIHCTRIQGRMHGGSARAVRAGWAGRSVRATLRFPDSIKEKPNGCR